MKKNGFSAVKLLYYMLIFLFFWGIVMYVIDCSVPCLAYIPHRISGEVWFQLISNCLLALPSIGICAYAIIQTKNYHDLDEERLRPELLMESAEISMCMVGWSGFDHWTYSKDGIGVRQQEEYQQYRQNHKWKKVDDEEPDNLGYLVFKSDLILKGGESVRQITIQQVIIRIGNCQYLMKFDDIIEKNPSECGMNICFDRGYKNGQEEYHIEWHPDYTDIVSIGDEQECQEQSREFVRQGRDADYEQMQENFWNDMYNALVDSEYDVARKDMEWRISMSIEYGINKTRRGKMPESVDWRIRWNGEKREFVNDYTARQSSQEGMLSIG